MSEANVTTGVAAVVVMAAGKGTRMKSETSKLLHKVAGRTLVASVLNAAEALQPQHLVVVVGHQRDQVEAHLAEVAPGATIAVQENPNGTGDAVRCGLVPIPDVQGEVVVLNGDVPLLTGETLRALVDAHRQHGDAATVLTGVLDDAGAYGRIVRDEVGEIAAIVERKDCTPEQAALKEFNAGIYVFDADALRAGLASLTTNNAQGELYLTDVIAFAKRQGGHVHPLVMADRWEAEGVNDRAQLATLSRIKFSRIADAWMREGVTILDPATTWIEDSVDIEPDVTILPNTHLEGATTVRRGATIGPDTTLRDAEVGERATVVRTHGNLATIGADASVGPFAHLRPGTEIGDRAKVGAFVELRATIVDADGRVPALTSRDDHGPHDGPAAARAFEQN